MALVWPPQLHSLRAGALGVKQRLVARTLPARKGQELLIDDSLPPLCSLELCPVKQKGTAARSVHKSHSNADPSPRDHQGINSDPYNYVMTYM